MRFDVEDQVSDKQTFPDGVATVSTDVIPKPAKQDPSFGEGYVFNCFPTEEALPAVTTIKLKAVEARNQALTTNAVVLGEIEIPGTAWKPGVEIVIPIAKGAMGNVSGVTYNDTTYIGVIIEATGGDIKGSVYYMPEKVVNHKLKYFPKVVNMELT